jgi:hypothetical protein
MLIEVTVVILQLCLTCGYYLDHALAWPNLPVVPASDKAEDWKQFISEASFVRNECVQYARLVHHLLTMLYLFLISSRAGLSMFASAFSSPLEYNERFQPCCKFLQGGPHARLSADI